MSILSEDPLARSSLHCTNDEQGRPIFYWALPSRASELLSQSTAVNIERCYNLQPQLDNKEQARHFWRTLSGEHLLRAFHDLLSRLEYTKTRVQLSSKLYMFVLKPVTPSIISRARILDPRLVCVHSGIYILATTCVLHI